MGQFCLVGGDSLLRDMLDAGVLDCLNGEFGNVQVSVRCCVLAMWLTFVTNSADQPLRWPISVANLEDRLLSRSVLCCVGE